MKKSAKFAAVALALGFAITGAAAGSVRAEAVSMAVPTAADGDVLVENRVNWESGTIDVMGTGRLPQDVEQGAEDIARRAAIMDAYRQLAETINGVQVDADSVMEMLLLKQDTVRTKVAAVIKGAKVTGEGTRPNGSYYVKMTVPMYGVGSLAEAALPEIMPLKAEPLPVVAKAVITKQEVTEIKKTTYTGVIVDAGGLGLMPAMSPVIYDTNGRAVYGAKNIDSMTAIRNGMVGYVKSVEEAKTSVKRVGEKALIVKAVSVKGGSNSVNPVNVVISPEDADRILISNQSDAYLQKGAVMFVR